MLYDVPGDLAGSPPWDGLFDVVRLEIRIPFVKWMQNIGVKISKCFAEPPDELLSLIVLTTISNDRNGIMELEVSLKRGVV